MTDLPFVADREARERRENAHAWLKQDSAPAAIEAKKHAMRQTQEGSWLVTLSLHQADVPHWLFTAPVGQRMALAELTILADEQERPLSTTVVHRALDPVTVGSTPPGAAKEKRKPLSPGSRAALMCKDPRAWPVISRCMKYPRQLAGEAEAADILRAFCRVVSRAELTDDNQIWRTLEADYERAIGKIG